MNFKSQCDAAGVRVRRSLAETVAPMERSPEEPHSLPEAQSGANVALSTQDDDLGAQGCTRLSFVRHAQALSNVDGVIRGETTCGGLTEQGREQAGCLARRLELDQCDDPVTQVYSTPLARAVETAEPVAQILGLRLQYLPQWRYANYGAAEGKTWREVYRDYPDIHPALHPDRPIAEGAETMIAFRAATSAAITELTRRHPGEHILLFGSTENFMAAEEILLDLPPDARTRSKIAIDHTGIMTFDLVPAPWSPTGRRAVLVRHNDSSHLPLPQRRSRFRSTGPVGS
ncbi:putative phosphoglycerate mutase [Nocardia sp. GAS34]|uniref:histidine phosphatase family protein n=1 Tax=unclassified Nocardia TaxID=2637762 RepID=UPI003D1A5F8F